MGLILQLNLRKKVLGGGGENTAEESGKYIQAPYLLD